MTHKEMQNFTFFLFSLFQETGEERAGKPFVRSQYMKKRTWSRWQKSFRARRNWKNQNLKYQPQKPQTRCQNFFFLFHSDILLPVPAINTSAMFKILKQSFSSTSHISWSKRGSLKVIKASRDDQMDQMWIQVNPPTKCKNTYMQKSKDTKIKK